MSKLAIIPSLPINAPEASHRIVGTHKTAGSGVMGYYTRYAVSNALRAFLDHDPDAKLRIEPHHQDLMGKALRSTDVEWIVNDRGELGVKIGQQFFFLYKGHSFMYSLGGSRQYRHVGEREFGESGPIAPEGFRDSDGWLDLRLDTANNDIGCDS